MADERNESTSEETIQEPGTTERLFGKEETEASLETTPSPVVAQKAAEPPVKSRDESGKFVSQKINPEPSSDSEYLLMEALGDKKVKVKIGGEEKDITLRDLQKGYQTDQYLTQKGQRLAEEYKALQATKAKPEPSRVMPLETKATEPDDEFYREYIKPSVDRQMSEIDVLKQELNRLKAVTGPLEYQSNLAKVASAMKEQGYDDFLKYESEIRQKIYAMPVEQQVAFDTDAGFISIYKDIKLAEYKQAISQQSGTKLPDQRPTPKIVNIEGGGGSPSGTDDSMSKLNMARKKAQESGRMKDWAAYTELKYSGGAGG